MVVDTASVFNKQLNLDNMTLNDSHTRELVLIAALCNNASFDPASKTAGINAAEWKVNGDATDAAILRFAQRYLDVDKSHDDYEKVGLTFCSSNYIFY